MEPSADAIAGMLWWNSLTPAERVYWMDVAGNTGVAADAWEAFKIHRRSQDADSAPGT
jgi:hypothetical protein